MGMMRVVSRTNGMSYETGKNLMASRSGQLDNYCMTVEVGALNDKIRTLLVAATLEFIRSASVVFA